MSSRTDSARAIVEKLGGVQNISSMTHCATRLRFELHDSSLADQEALEKIDGVLGVVAAGASRMQVVCGGAVESMYTAIQHLPEMKEAAGDDSRSAKDIKAEARSQVRGRYSWLDNFFEFLSDSFRPILGVLLGASLIIAIAAVLDAAGVVDFRADDKAAGWVFLDAMWRSVFYFLPIMVAYNASAKLKVDPWVGAAVMFALMTPEFLSLSDTERFADTMCTVNETLGKEQCVAYIFGLPLQLNDYGGQVFVPLFMVAILALVYHGLKKIFPADVQMVFVPFLSLLVMIPFTAFLIGPMGVWVGNLIGGGLAWMNGNAPFVFSLLIPMLYPFLVPLGLHWPLNALMLVNIQTLGYDFIQGPMGAWNAACFGATAGVLLISLRERDVRMRQTASGALAAGLFGGISEPSLYGIHLRFKRIYPRMLLGCFAGGLSIAILSAPYGGVKTSAFVFSSLLTIPVFDPMWVYALSYFIAFGVACSAIFLTDYRTPEQKAEAAAVASAEPETESEPEAPSASEAASVPQPVQLATVSASAVGSPLAGESIELEATGDKVFSSGALGAGVGIIPAATGVAEVGSPVAGQLRTVAKTGHAFGIRTDEGVEVLVHVGIDTVKMEGEGFEVRVAKGERVEDGQALAEVNFGTIEKAGYSPITLVTVTNTKKLTAVTPLAGRTVTVGEPIIEVEP